MECFSGANNWRLTVRREAEGVTLLRAATCDVRAALPETLFGLPVTALGDRALAPSAGAAEGEEVLLTCGQVGESALWSNETLRELTLPRTLRRVGDYALLNCAQLRLLRLTDGISFWGGSVLMNCRALNAVEITRESGAQGESAAYFADELPRELDITITEADGRTARLLFPEYVELYEENCPAHHFDYNILGAGYPYHHCFREKKLNLAAYDALWQAFLNAEYDEDAALRLAWYRLRWPLELAEGAEQAYLAYLRIRLRDALFMTVRARDAAGARFLLARTAPKRELLSEACALAREENAPELVALLLEELHRRFPTGAERQFAL